MFDVFTATFMHMAGYMSRVASKSNEEKSKMKHPSDMPTPRFELSWSNARPVRPRRRPDTGTEVIRKVGKLSNNSQTFQIFLASHTIRCWVSLGSTIGAYSTNFQVGCKQEPRIGVNT